MDISSTQGEILLQINQCIYVTDASAPAASLFPTNPVPVAVYEASTCPTGLNVSGKEYASLFKGKLAIWLRDVDSDISCDPSNTNPDQWYYSLVEAGTVGVIQIVPEFGRDAGIWYQSTDILWANYNNTIPVAYCANTGIVPGVPASQSRLKDFLSAWLESDLTARSSPFAESLMISNITITDNLWEHLFALPLYRFVFHILVPLFYFYVAILAFLFAKERFSRSYRTSRKSLRKTLKVSFTPPFMALIIECISTAFTGIFYCVDGMWANPNPGMHRQLRPLFFGTLLMISMSSSVLVALNFADFRKAHRDKTTVGSKSFLDRHRKMLLFTAAVFTLLEIATALLRQILWFYPLANLFSVMCGGVVSVWFAFEAYSFSSTLQIMASTTGGGNYQLDQSLNRIYSDMVRRISRCSYMASLTLMLQLVLAVAATFHPSFMWRVGTWPFFWFFAHVFRSGFSLSKVLLCRLPKNEGQTNTSSKRTTYRVRPTAL